MRRTRPFSTLLSSLSLFSQCIALAHHPAPGPKLSPREEFEYPKEHVILADCTQGEERHLSSQMAYYNSTPNDKPMDIAIVDTQPGQFALWINSNTTAIFTDTGVYFTATLGPKVPDGEWAGYGHNGMGDLFFHNFNCWRSYQFNLYEWQNARCSQVYYCNHDPRPANAPEIVVTTSEVPHTTQTLAPGASGAVPGGDSSGTGDQSSSPGLSHGGLIGTIVGSVAVVVIGGLLGLWFLFRRRSRNINKNKTDTDTFGDIPNTDDGAAELGDSRDRKSFDHASGRQELDAKLERVEMDTETHRFEMADNVIAELDGTPVGWDTKDPSDIKLYDLKQDTEVHNRDSKGGDFKYHPETRDNGDVIPTEPGEMGDNDAVFDEPKTMFGDELKARAIDKQVIRASTGAGSATVVSWTNKDKEEQGRTEERQKSGDDLPFRGPPTRSQTAWTTWTTDSDVDLAGFPLSSVNPVPISPISPLSPSGPRPPNG